MCRSPNSSEVSTCAPARAWALALRRAGPSPARAPGDAGAHGSLAPHAHKRVRILRPQAGKLSGRPNGTHRPCTHWWTHRHEAPVAPEGEARKHAGRLQCAAARHCSDCARDRRERRQRRHVHRPAQRACNFYASALHYDKPMECTVCAPPAPHGPGRPARDRRMRAEPGPLEPNERGRRCAQSREARAAARRRAHRATP